ncbi:MAG: CopG family transcriptional regulator [Actinobacteria bacterium]|nr:CopG family transcriptional regulator [Actinomycetota bacterium]MCB9389947.1 CopG family transcriptional regulator [Acidimicrobiia bacterium]
MPSYSTKSGRTLTEADLDGLAEQVESADYDIEQLKSRGRGRPAMGSAPASVVPVRIDPELLAAIEERADADRTTTSAIIRQALREFLNVA